MAAQKRSRAKSRGVPAKAARSPVMNVVNVGHQIWLAGLGALARAQSEGPKLFEELAEEGSVVQERQRESAQRMMKEVRGAIDTRTEAVRGKASDTLESLEKLFQARVQKALQQLGMPTTQEIQALSRKVNELNRSIQDLTRANMSASARKKAAAASQEGALV
jgi:poly(hydroxyalkanoate) granule-associated protein